MTPFDGRLCQDKCDAVAEEGKRQTEEHRINLNLHPLSLDMGL